MRFIHVLLAWFVLSVAFAVGVAWLSGCAPGEISAPEPAPEASWTVYDVQVAVQSTWLSTVFYQAECRGQFPYFELEYEPIAEDDDIVKVYRDPHTGVCTVLSQRCHEVVQALLWCAQETAGCTLDDFQLTRLEDDASWPCDRERDVTRVVP